MWFLEKVRASPGEASLLGPLFPALGQAPPEKSPPGAPAATAAFSNVLTPDRIPEFCIPPRLAGPPLPKSPSPAFVPRRCLTEPGLQEAASPVAGSALPHLIQVEIAEEPPEGPGGGGDSEPGSRAALSLPHVPRARTSYGFCRLLESPHTRRKESIFHGEAPAGALPLPLPRERASSCSGRQASSSPIAIRRPFRAGTWDSGDTASSSSESSPFGSPLLGRSPARPGSLVGKARSHEGLLGKAWRARRLSGLPRAGSLSTEESSSTDSSPSSPRRASEGLPERCRLSPPALFPLELPRERLGRESTVALARGALLRLSSEYCAESRRLRVRLISAEGLYQGAELEPRSIHCCVAFALLPGKLQKQRSAVIRRSRNPIFNEDFFFLGIAEEHLGALALRMKAINKGGSMKRDLVLGESQVPLPLILAG